MRRQNPYPAKITGVLRVRRLHQPGEPNRGISAKREPPMPRIERRNARASEKGQSVQFGQHLGDVIVLPVDLSYPVNRLVPTTGHLPSTTFTPSQIAPMNPVTTTVTTALKV